ncbi:putative beta-glucosidase E [Venturia inaequalis]|uniref:Uncharacterized protein n=1 Tax=Venturia inaequalis TaxID=5025 RepID=A0A8H3YV84_VENIN|nr:hypothetical protein EG327_010292 [Venturia inaequalis]RDI79838.1 putative beta-glucosidase E [Venturia inaequalis]
MLPFINIPFVYLSGILVKLTASFLISYPLTAVLKRIPDNKPWQKNAFNIAVSMFYLVGLFSLWGGLRTLLISSIGSYCIAMFVQGPFMPWIGFVFCMGHMSINHIARMDPTNDSGAIDITGAQMVLVMKMTAFCWNVHDGRLPASELSDLQKTNSIKEMPSLLDFFGYVFFFPALLVGPAFDYQEYKTYISTKMFELPPGVDPSKAPPTRKKRKIPRSGTPAAIKAVCGLFWIFAFLQLNSRYPPEYFLTDDYMKYSIFRRIFILYMLGVSTRTKYYGVWFLSEGSCILSGIGYNGIDEATGRAKWDRLSNVKPMEVETAQNVRAYLGGWNVNTNHWLRNYMYLRVTPKGKKPGFQATLATFVTSAFWHGFYPGYYLSFVLASLMQNIAKYGRRLIRPFFMSKDGKTPTANKKYYDAFTWFITQLAFCFVTAPFNVLTLSAAIKVWSRVYFYGLVGVAICFGFLYSPARPMLASKLRKRNGTDGKPQLDRQTSHDSAKIPPGGTLGLPDDPEKELQELVKEVQEEVAKRKRRGSNVSDVKAVLQQKIEEFRRKGISVVDGGKKVE